MSDRLVYLHGFTQNHHLWKRPARAIADAHRAAGQTVPAMSLVDLPGHGLATPPTSPGLDDVADELLRSTGPGTYVGYSMGGRLALRAALRDTERRIERLVLIGATAGLDDPTERAERRAADDRLADRIEAIGVDAFLAEWLALPLFAGLTPEQQGLGVRRRNSAEGLAASLRCHGTGRQGSLWNDLAHLQIRVLVVAGELDTKFTDIGQRLAAALPRGELATVDGATHSAHLEQPEAFATLLLEWLGVKKGSDPFLMTDPETSGSCQEGV